MSEHSPLPWQVVEGRDSDNDPIVLIADASGGFICEAHGCGDTADCESFPSMLRVDAEFVVKAVNNHERLVEMVRHLLYCFDPDMKALEDARSLLREIDET